MFIRVREALFSVGPKGVCSVPAQTCTSNASVAMQHLQLLHTVACPGGCRYRGPFWNRCAQHVCCPVGMLSLARAGISPLPVSGMSS
jgi:hypothetical protein